MEVHCGNNRSEKGEIGLWFGNGSKLSASDKWERKTTADRRTVAKRQLMDGQLIQESTGKIMTRSIMLSVNIKYLLEIKIKLNYQIITHKQWKQDIFLYPVPVKFYTKMQRYRKCSRTPECSIKINGHHQRKVKS